MALTAIQADGWRATYGSPPTEFDPVGSPETFTVTRSGFDATGAATTVNDTITIMKRVRLPYPDHATLTASDVSLSDRIFAGDTISGVTNNSTRTYPKAVCLWLKPDLERIYTESYTAKLAVAHCMARNGRPVAAVKFIATDGTNTVEQIVSTMTKTDYSASGLSVPHFEATLDLTTLNDDADITIDAVIYPWAGTSSQISVDYDTYPSIQTTTLSIFNAVSDVPIYAYVDPAGDNGTGVASTTDATAAANPFATIAAAIAACSTIGGDTSRAWIKLNNGSYGYESLYNAGTQTDVKFPVIIEAVNPGLAVYQSDTAGGAHPDVPRVSHWKGVKFQQLMNNPWFLSAYVYSGLATSVFIAEDCIYDANGFTPGSLTHYATSRIYHVNCSGDMRPNDAYSTTLKTVNIIGCGGQFTGSSVYNAVGCKDHGSYGIGTKQVVGSRPKSKNSFFGWNFLSSLAAQNITLLTFADTDAGEHCAVVGNIAEVMSLSQPASLSVVGGDGFDLSDMIWFNNTTVGQRSIYNYSDLTSSEKNMFYKWNIDLAYNSKGDVFDLDGTSNNNWENIYRVNFRHNMAITGASSGGGGFFVGSWMGEVAEIGYIGGSTSTPATVDFVNDISATGVTGGGDYHLGASTVAPQIPANEAPYPYDLYGNVINLDGSAYIGAANGVSAGGVDITTDATISIGATTAFSVGYNLTTDATIGVGVTTAFSVGYNLTTDATIGVGVTTAFSVGYGFTTDATIGVGAATAFSVGYGFTTDATIGVGATTAFSVGYGFTTDATIGVGATTAFSVGYNLTTDATISIGATTAFVVRYGFTTDATIGIGATTAFSVENVLDSSSTISIGATTAFSVGYNLTTDATIGVGATTAFSVGYGFTTNATIGVDTTTVFDVSYGFTTNAAIGVGATTAFSVDHILSTVASITVGAETILTDGIHVRATIRNDIKSVLDAALPLHTVFASRRYKINETELPAIDMRIGNENINYQTMGRVQEREASLYIRSTRIASDNETDALLDEDAVLIEEALANADIPSVIYKTLVQTNFSDGGDASKVVAEVILRYDIGYRTVDNNVTIAKG